MAGPSFRSPMSPPAALPPHMRTIPVSPTLTSTTNASGLDLAGRGMVVITRADLRQSLGSFETLLTNAKAFRNSLISLAHAQAGFAQALEECGRVKGARTAEHASDITFATSGLMNLESNLLQVLSDSFYRNFEVPLLDHFDNYTRKTADRHQQHQQEVEQKVRAIRKREAENVKLGRGKGRSLSSFREALGELQRQVDDLDQCKIDYYEEVLDGEEDVWGMVADKVALFARQHLEIHDRLASKGVNDPILERLSQEHSDPFNAFSQGDEDGKQLFSILPPLSILTPSQALRRRDSPENTRPKDKNLKGDEEESREAEDQVDSPAERRSSQGSQRSQTPVPRAEQSSPEPRPAPRPASPDLAVSANSRPEAIWGTNMKLEEDNKENFGVSEPLVSYNDHEPE